MDSKGPNFSVAETCALLEGVQGLIIGGFSSAKGGEVTKKGKENIWKDITNHVNTTGFGQKRTIKQVMLQWKNLKTKATKDVNEAKKNPNSSQAIQEGEIN